MLGGCQNYGPLLGPLNTRCRIILRTQKGTIVLTTTHIQNTNILFVGCWYMGSESPRDSMIDTLQAAGGPSTDILYNPKVSTYGALQGQNIPYMGTYHKPKTTRRHARPTWMSRANYKQSCMCPNHNYNQSYPSYSCT